MDSLKDIIGRGGNPSVGQFGFHRQPQGSLPEAIGQAYTQNVAPDLRQIQEEGFGLDYPSLETLERNMPQDVSLSEIGQEGLEKALDLVTPLGIGTILGPTARGFHRTMGEAQAAGLNPLRSQEGAETFLKEGMPARLVTQKTGYYQDRFGNWKTQIDDIGSGPTRAVGPLFKQWKPSQKLNEGGRWPERQLEKVFHHPTLYENYPWMKGDNVKVRFSTETKYASAKMDIDPKTGRVTGGTIFVNPQGVQEWKEMYGLPTMNEAYRSMMLHEVQHVVQGIDNLPSGSSEDWFESILKKAPLIKKEINSLDDSIRKLPDGVPLKQQKIDRRDSLQRHIDFMEANKGKHANLKYTLTQGEMDAQWVQANRDVEDVWKRHPIQEDRGATYQDEGIRQVKFMEDQVALTSPGYGVVGTRPDTRPLEMLSPLERKNASVETPWTASQDFSDLLSDISPMAQEAKFGMKPKAMANLYHGTNSPRNYKDILESGFTKGRSSELGVSGTSVSRDPLVSTRLFSYDDPSLTLKVDYTGELENVRNLRPSEYYAGVTAEPGQAYGKPQTAYHESEIFGVRGSRLNRADEERLAVAESHLNNQKAVMNRMFNRHQRLDTIRKNAWDAKLEAAEELGRHHHEMAVGPRGRGDPAMEQIKIDLERKKDAADAAFEDAQKAYNQFDEIYEAESAKFRELKRFVERGGDSEPVHPPFKARKATETEQEQIAKAMEQEEKMRGAVTNLADVAKSIRYIGDDNLTPAHRYAIKKSLQELVTNLNNMKQYPGYYERFLARRDIASPFSDSAEMGFADDLSLYELFTDEDMWSHIVNAGYKPAQASKIEDAAQYARSSYGDFLASRDEYYNKVVYFLKNPQSMMDRMFDGSLSGENVKKQFSAWKEAKGIKAENYELSTLSLFLKQWAKDTPQAANVDASYRIYKKMRNKFMDTTTKEIGTFN